MRKRLVSLWINKYLVSIQTTPIFPMLSTGWFWPTPKYIHTALGTALCVFPMLCGWCHITYLCMSWALLSVLLPFTLSVPKNPQGLVIGQCGLLAGVFYGVWEPCLCISQKVVNVWYCLWWWSLLHLLISLATTCHSCCDFPMLSLWACPALCILISQGQLNKQLWDTILSTIIATVFFFCPWNQWIWKQWSPKLSGQSLKFSWVTF